MTFSLRHHNLKFCVLVTYAMLSLSFNQLRDDQSRAETYVSLITNQNASNAFISMNPTLNITFANMAKCVDMFLK